MDIEVIADPAPFTIIAYSPSCCVDHADYVEEGFDVSHVDAEALIPALADLDKDDEDWEITVLCREPRPDALIQIQEDLRREVERRAEASRQARIARWERTRREDEARERATLARLKEKYEGT